MSTASKNITLFLFCFLVVYRAVFLLLPSQYVCADNEIPILIVVCSMTLFA